MSDGRTQAKKDTFRKFDSDKLDWSLLSDTAAAEIVKVFMYGAKKYGKWNWIDNADQIEYSRLINSAERHLKAFKNGQDLDPETGLSELAHLGCNIFMLLLIKLKGRGIDDRRKDL